MGERGEWRRVPIKSPLHFTICLHLTLLINITVQVRNINSIINIFKKTLMTVPYRLSREKMVFWKLIFFFLTFRVSIRYNHISQRFFCALLSDSILIGAVLNGLRLANIILLAHMHGLCFYDAICREINHHKVDWVCPMYICLAVFDIIDWQ